MTILRRTEGLAVVGLSSRELNFPINFLFFFLVRKNKSVFYSTKSGSTKS